jgi:hypothetical protein
MKTVIQPILVSIFGIIVALVIIEIGFRMFYDFSPRRAQWSDRPDFYFRAEKSSTLQDYYYSPVKPSGTFRIGVAGDSYTFAPYMQFTDTFPKKLEQMLNLNDTPKKAEVINYGVPAYSTSHEVALVERAVNEQADLVLLQVTLNDAELKPYVPTGITADQKDEFGEIVFSPRTEILVSYWKSLGFVLTRLHNQRTHDNYKNYFISLFENKRGWATFTKSVESIQEICKSKNVELAAVIFPLFGVPLDEKYPFRELHEKIGKYFAEHGIKTLDLLKSYENLPIERIQVIPGGDRHGNELIHRIAAEKIYSWLESQNLIPTELKIKYKYSERLGITNKGLILADISDRTPLHPQNESFAH